MGYDPVALDKKFRLAIKEFWSLRASAKARGAEKSGRGEATAGVHLNPLLNLIAEFIRSSGLSEAEFYRNRQASLPGYFRPAKQWDLVVLHKGSLAAAIELKSQVGSYGNNFNNRVEEALGSASDLDASLLDGPLRQYSPDRGHLRPFRGWLMILAEEEESTRRGGAPNALFDLDPVFLRGGRLISYAERYEKFTSRLVLSKKYDAAAIVLAKKTDGSYRGYGLEAFWRELSCFASKAGSIS